MKQLFANKYLWVLVIIFGLNIPLAMIEGQIEDRTQQRNVAKNSVRQSWTGEQDVFAGVMVIPYQKKVIVNKGSNAKNVEQLEIKWVESRQYILADSITVESRLKSQKLVKGIYRVPVYTADINIAGRFDLTQYAKLKADESVVFKRQPFIALGVNDSRGLLGVPKVLVGESALKVEPGTGLDFYASGFNAHLDDSLIQGKQFSFSAEMQLNGMEALSYLTAAKESSVSVSSDWPHPEFFGAFLPVKRSISDQGFSASWQTSLFATSIGSTLQQCFANDCRNLKSSLLGVRHIQPVDIYLKSLRSIKYGFLVILVTFCVFALYELLSRQIAIHPISYLLTGSALAIFFLLLIALSEHWSFGFAYWLASLSCSSLIAFYVASQSGSKSYGAYIMAILNSLYTILYFIIRSEDHALLSGTLLLFFILATIMTVTRKLDWYQVMSRKHENS